jgi:hypothetical protein
VIGQFAGNRGEFSDQEEYKERAIFVRYVWPNIRAEVGADGAVVLT